MKTGTKVALIVAGAAALGLAVYLILRPGNESQNPLYWNLSDFYDWASGKSPATYRVTASQEPGYIAGVTVQPRAGKSYFVGTPTSAVEADYQAQQKLWAGATGVAYHGL